MQYRLVVSVAASIIAVLLTFLWFGAMIPTCSAVKDAEKRISQLEADNAQILKLMAKMANNQASLFGHQSKCLDLAKKSQVLVEETKKMSTQIAETAELCHADGCRSKP